MTVTTPAHDTMRPLLGAVWETQQALDHANWSSNSPLGVLAPAGRHIRALENALNAALDLLGIPEHDTDRDGLQIQGRILTLRKTPR